VLTLTLCRQIHRGIKIESWGAAARMADNTRSILITGCSSGIGRASAISLHRRGWRVFATARRNADLADLASKGVEPVHLELRDPESVAACADRVLERTDGKLFAVFNNAAYGQPGAVEDLPGPVLRQQFEVNVFAWHDLTCRLVPAMRANGRGRIIQCSSVLGLISPPYRGAYNATKFALEALTDAMRHELADSGIKVSLIEPGPIETKFVDHALSALQSNIDIENSPHRERYQERLGQMRAGGSQQFKLEADKVVDKLIHALESGRPKTRYYVTVPTYVAAVTRHLLPRPIEDRIIASS